MFSSLILQVMSFSSNKAQSAGEKMMWKGARVGDAGKKGTGSPTERGRKGRNPGKRADLLRWVLADKRDLERTV